MLSTRSNIDLRIIECARRFHRVLTYAQLRSLGVSRSTIERLLRRGWLTRYAHGIYIVGTGELDAMGRMRAAALAQRGRTVASGLSTMYLLDVINWAPSTTSVLTTSHPIELPDVTASRTTSLLDEDVITYRGIDTARVERALVELSADTDPLHLVKYIARARYLHWYDVRRLEAIIERLKHRGTCTNIQRAVGYDKLGSHGYDSTSEEHFHRLVRASGLSEPLVNVHRDGLLPHERADFVWDEHMVVVEVDGPHHLDPEVQREDARRDAGLRAAGYRVVRIWWWELDECPRDVIARVRATLGT